MSHEWVTAWSGVATAVFTLAGVFVAWFQLSKIEVSLRMGSLMAVLEIETQMNERKVHFDKCSADIRLGRERNQPDGEMKILADLFNSAKENYFNALDRLCYCVLKEYLTDKDWRAEYRNVLMKTIEEFQDDFGEASQFRNIKKLNAKWQEA